MWLSGCVALTSESWKAIMIVNAAISNAVMKVIGLRILFTSADNLKNIVYRPVKNCVHFK